jgi:DNA-binding transcriptional regulator YiaG
MCATFRTYSFSERFDRSHDRDVERVAHLDTAITGHARRRSLYQERRRWHRVGVTSELRDLRRAVGLNQQAFAALLGASIETLRTWDSGRRPVPLAILQRARRAVVDLPRNTELLSLDQLARELGVHVRTLRAAARTGRLDVRLSSRSVYGRPIRFTTRTAAATFMERYYRQSYSRAARRPSPPDMSVPSDYADRLLHVRRRLRLTQGQFAEAIGAANKAVVYQWESKKRTPSPVFWQKIAALEKTSIAARRHVLA